MPCSVTDKLIRSRRNHRSASLAFLTNSESNSFINLSAISLKGLYLSSFLCLNVLIISLMMGMPNSMKTIPPNTILSIHYLYIHYLLNTTNLSKSTIQLLAVRKGIPSTPCTCIPDSSSICFIPLYSSMTENTPEYSFPSS